MSTGVISEASAIDEAKAQASHRFCAQLTREQARNFYYGMRLLPEPKRSAMYAVYAWMRAADDLADEPGEPEAKREHLAAFRAMTDQALSREEPAPDGPVSLYAEMWPAVQQTFHRYHVKAQPLHDMIAGQMLDLTTQRYADFEALSDYCRKVASTVGQVCITIWGYEGGEQTLALAEARGIAFQLTNILRDLVEDASRDRVYLPEDELAGVGLGREDFVRLVRSGQADERFDRLMAGQLERVAGFYARSEALEQRIEADARPTSWAMMRIYRGLLEKIARQPRQVLAKRVRLNKLQKLQICLSANWRRTLGG